MLSGRARERARGAFWSSAFGSPALATPLVSAPWPRRPVRKNTEAHFPPPQELRVRSWFLGSPRNVALKKNGVHLHNALFALCKFLSLNPQNLHLLPWCRFSLRSLLRHLRQWCASWGFCSNNCSGELQRFAPRSLPSRCGLAALASLGAVAAPRTPRAVPDPPSWKAFSCQCRYHIFSLKKDRWESWCYQLLFLPLPLCLSPTERPCAQRASCSLRESS